MLYLVQVVEAHQIDHDIEHKCQMDKPSRRTITRKTSMRQCFSFWTLRPLQGDGRTCKSIEGWGSIGSGSGRNKLIREKWKIFGKNSAKVIEALESWQVAWTMHDIGKAGDLQMLFTNFWRRSRKALSFIVVERTWRVLANFGSFTCA